MPQKRSLAVETRPYERWAVQTAGSERATSLHETKADAIARAREVAKHRHAELVIKNKDGTIAQRDSYGPDRFPSRDKKR